MSTGFSVVAISALILAACSGAGDDASVSDPDLADPPIVEGPSDEPLATDQPPVDEPIEDEPLDEGSNAADDSEGDEATEDPSVDDAADAADDVTFVGDSDSNWCVAARDVEAASDQFELAGFGDPEAVEAGLGEMLGAFEFALQFAPPELAFDLEVSFASMQQVDTALAAAEYDFLNADLSILDDVDGSIQEANDRIEQYNQQVCGIPIDDEGDDTTLDEDVDGPDFDLTSGTIRQQIIDELVLQGFTADEAECIIDEIDFADPASLDDRDAIIDVFAACEISLERLAELAG
jgi:hypothetical protein